MSWSNGDIATLAGVLSAAATPLIAGLVRFWFRKRKERKRDLQSTAPAVTACIDL
jgi:hypothetical protein